MGFTIYNREFNSLTDFCTQMGFRRDAIRRFRLKNGIEDMVDGIIGYLQSLGGEVTFDGSTYPTVLWACKELNILVDDYLRFINYEKCTVAEAFEFLTSEPYVSGKVKVIRCAGNSYNTLEDACFQNNLSYSAVFEYAKRHHLSFKDALEKRVRGGYYINNQNKDYGYIIEGRHFKTKTEALHHYGLTYSSVKKYMDKYNRSFVDAVKDFVTGNLVREEKSFIVRGVDYLSLCNFAKAVGVPESTIRKKAKLEGLSLEDYAGGLMKKSTITRYATDEKRAWSYLTGHHQKILKECFVHGFSLIKNSDDSFSILSKTGDVIEPRVLGIYQLKKETIFSLLLSGWLDIKKNCIGLSKRSTNYLSEWVMSNGNVLV